MSRLKKPNRSKSPRHFDTEAVRAGHVRTPFGENSEPIFTTSSYTFDSAKQAAARFSGEEPGFVYSRFTNPTVSVFQDRLAALEGGEACVATSSGMAAILATFLGLLKQGDHIVSSKAIFGATTQLLNKYLSRYGIETSYVPLTDIKAWKAAIRENTKLLYLETPSNPLTEVADIATLAK
ncbi:MAG TPA: aminotransferase class I/II-fold pyridoxal phosphate-dependent enzyme, partial [Gammaproteobacteria bacterium]